MDCPGCKTTMALDEELKTCIECSGEFGPCCMGPDGVCIGCMEDGPKPDYVDQAKD